MIRIMMVMMWMMIIAIMIMMVSGTMMIFVGGAYEGDSDFAQVLRACVKAEREVAPIIQRLMIIISIIIIIIVISSNYTKVYHYH